jgi:hypothetical protein
VTVPDFAFRRISVTGHAEKRARERLLWEDDGHLEERIRADVRVALVVGRVTNVRPNWSRGQNADEPRTRSSCWYAWDVDASRCWILELRGPDLVQVSTVIAAVAVIADRSDDRHVRRGMKRRPA